MSLPLFTYNFTLCCLPVASRATNRQYISAPVALPRKYHWEQINNHNKVGGKAKEWREKFNGAMPTRFFKVVITHKDRRKGGGGQWLAFRSEEKKGLDFLTPGTGNGIYVWYVTGAVILLILSAMWLGTGFTEPFLRFKFRRIR